VPSAPPGQPYSAKAEAAAQAELAAPSHLD
jgi:hypothetical protein